MTPWPPISNIPEGYSGGRNNPKTFKKQNGISSSVADCIGNMLLNETSFLNFLGDINMVDWSAVSGMIDVFRLVKEHLPSTSSPEKKVLPPPISPPVQEEQEKQEQIEPYQAQLGQRHKYLRKKILQLNPREMSDFYGFEKVKQLEDCEAGLDEFPTKAIKRLEEFFFVSPKYLQEGNNVIFQSFFSDNCQRFVDEEFRSYFLCGPSFQEGQKDGLAYLVFCKEEGGYWRIIRSNVHAGFYSQGGGGHIIKALIDSMLNPDMSFCRPKTLCLDVSAEEWEKLCTCRWYNKGMHISGLANYKATDIYEHRFLRAQIRAQNRADVQE
jgi:hypothetical protein